MVRITLFSIVLAVAGAFGAAALSQEREEPLAARADAKALVERLGASDYADRKKAEEALLSLGRDAIPALREAKDKHPDAHVRFEAERLLDRIAKANRATERELAEPEDSPRRPGGPVGPGDSGREQLNELLRRLREQGAMNDDYLEHLRKMLEESPSGAFPGFAGSMRGAIRDNEKQMEWERSMDGRIRVTVTRNGETETFDAENLEELKETAPDVYKEIAPHLGQIRVRVGPPPDDDGWWKELEERQRRLWKRWFELPNRPRWPGEPTPAWPERPTKDRTTEQPAPGGFRLGVWISDVPEVLREHLGLRPGDGALIEDVVPGSVADRMGLQRMDILRTLNGEKVSSAENIRGILGSLEDGAKIEAGIIRRGRPEKLLSTR